MDIHLLIPLLDQSGLCLPVTIKGPRQHRLSQRQLICTGPHTSGISYVPRLAITIHFALHEGLLCDFRNPRSDQLPRQDLVVMGVPVWFLLLREGSKELFRNDVLDAVKVGRSRIAIKEDALRKVLVDLVAKWCASIWCAGSSFIG